MPPAAQRRHRPAPCPDRARSPDAPPARAPRTDRAQRRRGGGCRPRASPRGERRRGDRQRGHGVLLLAPDPGAGRRLVASRVSPGASSSSPASTGPAGRRCSRLSARSERRRRLRWARSRSTGGAIPSSPAHRRPAPAGRPRVREGREVDDHNARGGRPATTRPAACWASPSLATPPGPVSVTSRRRAEQRRHVGATPAPARQSSTTAGVAGRPPGQVGGAGDRARASRHRRAARAAPALRRLAPHHRQGAGVLAVVLALLDSQLLLDRGRVEGLDVAQLQQAGGAPRPPPPRRPCPPDAVSRWHLRSRRRRIWPTWTGRAPPARSPPVGGADA